MRRTNSLAVSAAALLLLFAAVATATAHEDHGMDMNTDNMDMDINMAGMTPPAATQQNPAENGPMSYFAYGKHSSTILAHIILMVVAWCFVLPAGKQVNSLLSEQPLRLDGQ